MMIVHKKIVDRQNNALFPAMVSIATIHDEQPHRCVLSFEITFAKVPCFCWSPFDFIMFHVSICQSRGQNFDTRWDLSISSILIREHSTGSQGEVKDLSFEYIFSFCTISLFYGRWTADHCQQRHKLQNMDIQY